MDGHSGHHPVKIPRPPHNWSLSPSRAIAVQKKLAGLVRRSGAKRTYRLAAGVDGAFSADGRLCFGGAVLWDMLDQKVVELRVASEPVRLPYVPGLLTFREAPALIKALRLLRRRPDVLVCDGQGIAHPRRLGIASHLGLLCDLPSIGCAKSRLCGSHAAVGEKRGDRQPLFDGREVIGCVLRSRDRVRPLYISIGHRLDLDTAVELVLRAGMGYRLPEPTRLADQVVAKYKRQWHQGLPD